MQHQPVCCQIDRESKVRYNGIPLITSVTEISLAETYSLSLCQSNSLGGFSVAVEALVTKSSAQSTLASVRNVEPRLSARVKHLEVPCRDFWHQTVRPEEVPVLAA